MNIYSVNQVKAFFEDVELIHDMTHRDTVTAALMCIAMELNAQSDKMESIRDSLDSIEDALQNISHAIYISDSDIGSATLQGIETNLDTIANALTAINGREVIE